ncbi:MAG TPA: hypothetical protein VM534_02310, partial [Thermoanaerobaculia bacterium]|nr:hypothetical protein [Thermoanaerobaculia bacterium]
MALSRLFSRVFGDERPVEVWDWKYFRAPFGAESWVYESEGEIVAHAGGTIVELAGATPGARAIQLVDFMSRPDFAGGIGAGSAFARATVAMFSEVCRNRAFRVAYGFPGERHRLVGERILGYRAAERVMDLVLDPIAADVEPVPLEETHLEMLEGDFGLGVRRSPAYLRWRYLDHPRYRYGVVTARSGPLGL